MATLYQGKVEKEWNRGPLRGQRRKKVSAGGVEDYELPDFRETGEKGAIEGCLPKV